jgi:hypothetical protein
MQTLRDAAILLGIVLVVSSVRVSRVEPVTLDVVPQARAEVVGSMSGSTSGAAASPARTDAGSPVPAGGAPDACQVEMLRIETRAERNGVLSVRVEPLLTSPIPRSRASRIG